MNFQKMMNPTGIPFIISNHFPAQLIKQFHGVLQKLYFFYYKAFPAILDIRNKNKGYYKTDFPKLGYFLSKISTCIGHFFLYGFIKQPVLKLQKLLS